MSSHFLGSADKPFQCNQLSTWVYPSAADSVAPLVVADVTYMALSSTYIMRSRSDHLLVSSSLSSRRLAVYSTDNIGERGEPCGVVRSDDPLGLEMGTSGHLTAHLSQLSSEPEGCKPYVADDFIPFFYPSILSLLLPFLAHSRSPLSTLILARHCQPCLD
jgi:hypothetical protein